MDDALVTTLAPVKRRLLAPCTSIAPPVSVVPLKLVKPPVSNSAPPLTSTLPVLLKAMLMSVLPAPLLA